MKTTSKQAYLMAKDSGLLSKQRDQVFKWFCENAPCTTNELIKAVGEDYKPLFREAIHINKIPSALEKMELIQVKTTRMCEVTGNNSEVWELTYNVPVKLPKKISAKKKLDMVLNLVSHHLEELGYARSFKERDTLIESLTCEIKEVIK